VCVCGHLEAEEEKGRRKGKEREGEKGRAREGKGNINARLAAVGPAARRAKSNSSCRQLGVTRVTRVDLYTFHSISIARPTIPSILFFPHS
jgi:hypothetical protein